MARKRQGAATPRKRKLSLWGSLKSQFITRDDPNLVFVFTSIGFAWVIATRVANFQDSINRVDERLSEKILHLEEKMVIQAGYTKESLTEIKSDLKALTSAVGQFTADHAKKTTP